MPFFSIRLKNYNLWLGKRDLSYFITDDDYFIHNPGEEHRIREYGVSAKYKRVFLSTDDIRRSLRCVNKQTILQTIQSNNGFVFEVLTRGESMGTFSRYVVVDLTDNKTYPLDDVIQGHV